MGAIRRRDKHAAGGGAQMSGEMAGEGGDDDAAAPHPSVGGDGCKTQTFICSISI